MDSNFSSKTQERIEQIQQLIKDNPLITYAKIGEHLGVSKQCIHNFMKKYFPNFNNKKGKMKKDVSDKSIQISKNSITKEGLVEILIVKHLLNRGCKPCFIIKKMNLNNTKFYNWKKFFIDNIEERIDNYNAILKHAKSLKEKGFKDYFIAKSCHTQVKIIKKWQEENYKPISKLVTKEMLKQYDIEF